MDEVAVGADEGFGRGFCPFGCWPVGQAPTVKPVSPGALEAASVASMDLDPVGLGMQQVHGDIPTEGPDESNL
jgi:hypothetical protein